jgi:hypothetical protein
MISMSDVRNEGFKIRVSVEQDISVQDYTPTPLDSGRVNKTITLRQEVLDISIEELSEAMADPVGLLKRKEVEHLADPRA